MRHRPRRVLSAVALAGALAFAAAGPAIAAAPTSAASSGRPIQHVIFALQSSHSFDNYFGTRPGVDGIPPGACQPYSPALAGPCARPFALDGGADTSVLSDRMGMFQKQYDGGRLDGFVSAYALQGQDGRVAMGHYTAADIPFYYQLADNYVLFDRYFASAPSGSVANHMFAVAAVPGHATPRGAVPSTGWGNTRTIFDELEQRGITWKYYVQSYDPHVTYRSLGRVHPDRAAQVVRVPLLGFPRFVDDPRLSSHIVDLSQYYVDLANGTLPQVSYIATAGANEHPPASIDAGVRQVRSAVSALQRSSAWSSSAFLLAWDSWGGWYDHVRPPRVGRTTYGFRVPALLISPYARRGYVDHTVLDHTSVLKFIEQNWSLPSLSSRDAGAQSIAGGFDFRQPPRPPQLLTSVQGGDLSAGLHRGRVYATYASAVGFVVLLALGVALRGGFGAAGRTRGRRWPGLRSVPPMRGGS